MSSAALAISDDELATVIHTTAKPYNPEPSTKTVAKTSHSDFDVDFDDEDAITTVGGLEKIVPADKNSVVRIALLSDVVSAMHSWSHFLVDSRTGKKTNVQCLTARDKKNRVIGEPFDCCKRTKDDTQQRAQHSFIVLALKYTSADNKTGKLLTDAKGELLPITYQFGFVKLGAGEKGSFRAVSKLIDGDEDGASNAGVHEIDILMEHKGDGFGYSYTRITRNARYRSNPALLAAVQADAAQYADGVALMRWLGRIVTPVEMRLILGSGVQKTPADINDPNDL
jgi:hypothetical protein